MGQEGEVNFMDEALLTDQRTFERLVAKATALLKNHRWGNGVVPHGITPEDLALDAIEDLFFNPSKWDRDAYPLPYPVLAGMVESKVANLVRSARNKVMRELAPGDEGPGKRDDHDLSELGKASDLIERIQAEVADDPEMLRYVRAAQSHDTRKEIAEELGLTVSQVTNLSKRVKRVFEGRGAEFRLTIDADQENS